MSDNPEQSFPTEIPANSKATDRANRRAERRIKRATPPGRRATLISWAAIGAVFVFAIIVWTVQALFGANGNPTAAETPDIVISSSPSPTASETSSDGESEGTPNEATAEPAPVDGEDDLGHLDPNDPTISEGWKDTIPPFAAVFGNPSVGKTAWLAALRPYMTDYALSQYADLDEDLYNVDPFTYGSYKIANGTGRDGWIAVDILDEQGNIALNVNLLLVQNETGYSWLVDRIGR